MQQKLFCPCASQVKAAKSSPFFLKMLKRGLADGDCDVAVDNQQGQNLPELDSILNPYFEHFIFVNSLAPLVEFEGCSSGQKKSAPRFMLLLRALRKPSLKARKKRAGCAHLCSASLKLKNFSGSQQTTTSCKRCENKLSVRGYRLVAGCWLSSVGCGAAPAAPEIECE